MLNRSKLLKEIDRVSVEVFRDTGPFVADALLLWQRLAADPCLAATLSATKVAGVPRWSGMIDDQFPVGSVSGEVHVIAVDGSQIYPDRHSGISCFLVNIGIVALHYGETLHGVRFDSHPYLYMVSADEESWGAEDLVNNKRQELELQIGVETAVTMQQQLLEAGIPDPVILLCDGSLIFWLLEARDNVVQQRFLPRYMAILDQLYTQHVLLAHYVSVSSSRDLIAVLKAGAAMLNYPLLDDQFRHIQDVSVVTHYLKPYHRTTVFCSQVSLTRWYPDQLRPYFFYLHVGTEIGRVEIPAYIAEDTAAVDQVASIVLSQALKGYGYPIALAEAHEQAVIKQPDRDFFYHMLQVKDPSYRVGCSPKALLKKRIAV